MTLDRIAVALAHDRGWTTDNAGEARVANALWRLHVRPGGPDAPVEQLRVGRYRLDFAWPAALVALEIDGYPHRSTDGALRDALRDHELAREGWIVVRVPLELEARALEEYLVRLVRFVRCARH